MLVWPCMRHIMYPCDHVYIMVYFSGKVKHGSTKYRRILHRPNNHAGFESTVYAHAPAIRCRIFFVVCTVYGVFSVSYCIPHHLKRHQIMRTTAAQRLLAAMEAHGIDPSKARMVFNAVHAPAGKTRAMVGEELSWAALQDSILRTERLTTSNRKKWRPEYRALYEEYVTVLRKIRDDIYDARNMLVRDPDDPHGAKVPATIKDITRLCAKRNAKTGVEGPTCTNAWQTWVAPDVRRNLCDRFDAAHALAGRKGASPRPFLSTATRQRVENTLENHRTFIARQRSVLCIPNMRHTVASTPYAALHLAAIRMAERELDNWESQHKRDPYLALNAPLPVNWLHLLAPDMRKRIAAADKNPKDVSLRGLDKFLMEDGTQPEGVDTSAPPDGQPDHDFDAGTPALITPPAEDNGEYED